MKKASAAAALIILITLITGCFLGFGPITPTAPEITLNENEIGLTQPLEFRIENWEEYFTYYVYDVNGQLLEHTSEGPYFTVTPEPEWENVNTLTVRASYVSETETKSAESTIQFKAMPRDRITITKVGNQVTLTPVIETIDDLTGHHMIWDIKFRVANEDFTGYTDTDPKLNDLPPTESLTVTVPERSYPEIHYTATLVKDKNPVADPISRTHHFPVNITDVFIQRKNLSPAGNILTLGFQCTTDYDSRLFQWNAVVNKKALAPIDLDRVYGSTIRFDTSIKLTDLKNDNQYRIEASYRSMDGSNRTIKSETDDFYYNI